jgi:hypothetical protein
MRAAVCNG